MAEKKHEALVRSGGAQPGDDAEHDGGTGLTRVSVTASDMPAPDPRHAGPEKLGVSKDVFDPNAARRNKLGYGPGLQDSEAKNPAVWVDETSEQARKAGADAHVQDAERRLEQARNRAKAIREGEPLDQEVK